MALPLYRYIVSHSFLTARRGLSYGVVCVIVVEQRLVTDGRTDGHTNGGKYRASIESRGA